MDPIGQRLPRPLLVAATVAAVLLLASAIPAAARREAGPIVFASDRGGQNDIWVMAPDGSNQVRLTDDKIDDITPAWSNDGKRIAWSRAGEIWVMNADGSGKNQVTFNTFGDFRPTWSPDASRIAFRSTRSSAPGIYVINVDGTGEQWLSNDLTTTNFAPDWSPDGTKIAFGHQGGVFTGHFSVWVMNADGTNAHQLTPDSMEAGLPGWSPDGSRILFADAFCNTCGESDLFVMNADGTAITQITDTPENELAKSWSRDGRGVVASFALVTPSNSSIAHLSKSDVAIIEVAAGATVNLTDSTGVSEGDADWAP
jgi:Tol biopolymer transport system component